MSPRCDAPDRPIPAPEVVAKYVYTNKAGKPSLQSQMGLEEGRNELDALTAATRGAAVQQLDLRPSTIRAQQPAVLQNVRDMVAKKYAGLDRYEDGCPVSRYIGIYLKNIHVKKGPRKYGRKATSSTAPHRAGGKAQLASTSKPARSGPGRDSTDIVPNNVPQESVLSQEPKGGNTPAAVGMRRVECLAAEYVSASTLTSLASNASRSIRDASPEVEYYNPIGPKARTGRSEPVETFLDSLRIPVPDRARIMELFELMGIHTQDYLELFATMETRDDGFGNSWLRAS